MIRNVRKGSYTVEYTLICAKNRSSLLLQALPGGKARLYAPKGYIAPEAEGKRGAAAKEPDGDREYKKRADYVQQLLFAVVDGRLGTDGEEILAEEAGDEQEIDGGTAEEVFV